MSYLDTTGITFIVDSDQKLNDWLHGVSGNDYTHVMIAPGRYELDYSIASTIKYLDHADVGTKTIEGAPGSVICDDNQEHSELSTHQIIHGLFGYQTQPTKDCYIKNITLELTKYCGCSPDYETGYSYIFFNCINIINCNYTGLGTYTVDNEGSTNGNGAPPSIATQCINISNCSFNVGYTSADHHQQGTICGLACCKNIDNCIFDITDESTYARGDDDTDFTYVYDCTNISNCVSYGTVSSHLGAGPSIFSACKNMTNIFVYDNNEAGDYYIICDCVNLNNIIAKFFSDCSAMSNCCGFTISQYGGIIMAAAKHYRCYADYSNSVAIADTANGGYNWSTS